MTTPNDARVRALVEQLDQAVPRKGDVVVDANPDDEGRTVVKATRLGYLRLGIEFLRAADAPARSDVRPGQLDLDLTYLTGVDNQCYSFELHENLPVWRPSDDTAGSSGGRGCTLIVALIAFFILTSLLVGAFTILRWLGGVLL